MINFFRKIRFNLMSNSKTGKPAFAPGRYLLYAIGEILLVVIGILIALQINIANEHRKEQNALKSQLQNISENLSNNEAQLQDLKEIRKQAASTSTNIINKYRAGAVINSDEYMEAHLLIAFEIKFVGEQSGFEQIKTSPLYDIDPLKKIRTLMVQYKKMSDDIEFFEQRMNTSSEALEGELWKNGFYEKAWFYFRKNAGIPTTDSIEHAVDFQKIIDGNGPLMGFFMRPELGMRRLIQKYDELLTIGDDLSNEIHEYIETNYN
jgi:Family of unknown function (DUF6090)